MTVVAPPLPPVLTIDDLPPGGSTGLQDLIQNAVDASLETALNAAIAGVQTQIGTLGSLTTTEKSNLVAALNEAVASVGTLSSLTTTTKTSLVAALNELKSTVASINDTSASSSTVYSSTKTNTLLAAKADDNAVVKTTGAQSVAGDKTTSGIWTFGIAPSVPDDSFAITKVTGLNDALAGKQPAGSYATTSQLGNVSADLGTKSSLTTTDKTSLVNAVNELVSLLATANSNIATKADDSAVVKLTGNQTVAGTKTFSSAPSVPDSSFAIAKTTGLQTALDNRVRHDAAQSLTTTQQAQARANIEARPAISPDQFGSAGGDDFPRVKAAFDAANARKVVSGTYADPGATVVLSGVYNLTSQNAPIDMMCNVQSDGATFNVPSGYSGTAVRVGHATSGNVLRNANIEVPSVIRPTVAGPGSLPAGSIGVLVRNLYTSDVKAGNILYHETGMQVGGESHGVAYNRIGFRTISYCKVRLRLKAIDSAGWSNQNTYIAGSTTGSIAWEGRRNTGSFGVLLDGTGGNTITGNTFVGCSFESDVYENVIEFRNAYQNQFYGCRHEQGIAATSCTLTAASATITSVGHFLSVGDMITFTGSSTPTGMNFDQPYYVVSVPTADTFTVSRARGGTAVTFSTVGTSIAFSRPQRVKYDKSWENVIDLPMGPLKWLDRTSVSAVPADTAGNQIRYPSRTTTDAYSPSEWPLHRARNRYTSGSSSQPLWAAYDSTTDPDESPSNWKAALTSKGFNFADGAGAELGWISNSGGVLKYQRLSDSVVYELASCRRTQSGTTLASGTTYNAGTRTSATVTLTGASSGDYVDISTTTGAIPLGLVIQAQVTSADTIQYTVDNLTGSNITLGSAVTLWFMASRRFF